MDENIIVCRNAAVDLGRFQIQPVNMKLPKGFIIGMEGKNGAGKSTFMKMLLGRFPKMSGTIEIAGLDVRKQREEMLQEVGFLIYAFSLYSKYLSAVKNR